jgi:AmmeMemoRadiSam system protein B
MFYPADKNTLLEMVHGFLDDADLPGPTPKAIIAPHAGYIYSGPIAASVYKRLQQSKDKIKHVILLGPSHRVPLLGIATPSWDFFSTPLGDIPVDKQAINAIKALPQVKIVDEAHSLEHCLEVQLPFLQATLTEFKITPLVVGDATAKEISEVIEALWGDDETLIVISSDLSHYHSYETARKMDKATSNAIESLNEKEIHYDDACGRNPILGLLLSAKKHSLRASTLDLRNSGDTAGPRDQVVGYGAYTFDNEH